MAGLALVGRHQVEHLAGVEVALHAADAGGAEDAAHGVAPLAADAYRGAGAAHALGIGRQRLPDRNCLHRAAVAGLQQELGGQTVAEARPAALGQAVRRPDGEVLAMARIEEIHRRLPNTHLVMHGSSSVPQELQDLFDAYGGSIRQDLGGAGGGDPARHPPRRAQRCRRYARPA